MKFSLVFGLALLLSGSAFAGSTLDASRYVTDLSVTSGKIAANSVTEAKIQLTNTGALKALNAAGSGNVNILHVDASNNTIFDQVPRTPSNAAPTVDVQVANKKYVDDQVASVPAAKTPDSDQIPLLAGDITAGYRDLTHDYVLTSVVCSNGPLHGVKGVDFTLSSVGGKTRVTFVITTGWGAGSPQNIQATDVLDCSGVY